MIPENHVDYDASPPPGDTPTRYHRTTTKTAPRRCVNTVNPRGLADEWSVDLMAIVPPTQPEPEPRPTAAALVDGCPDCVLNTEAPRATHPTPTGTIASYLCHDCGHAWTTSWGAA